MRARALLFAVVVGAAAFVPRGQVREAAASVSIAVTWQELLQRSTAAVVVVPLEEMPVWENGRIYTYTRVGVDRAMAGELHAGDDGVWIRTMGGVVGHVGQRVDGEAVLLVGRPSLVFLQPGPASSFEVTARGQGQFPVVLDAEKRATLIRSNAAGALLRPRGASRGAVLAADRIDRRALEDVAADVAAAWPHAHGG